MLPEPHSQRDADTNPQAATREDDRRKHPRHASSQTVFVRFQPEHPARFEIGTVLDVANEGIGLFLHRHVEPGTVIYLDFDYLGVRERTAKVVHSTPRGNGWRIGCQLERQFSASECRVLRK